MTGLCHFRISGKSTSHQPPATASYARLVDTRSKIITAEADRALARSGRPTALVSGHFDVLLAAHVGELARVRASLPDALLLVALTEPEHPVPDARARAGMVAALAMVDYVVSLEALQDREPPGGLSGGVYRPAGSRTPTAHARVD